MGKISAFWLGRLGTVFDAWIAERKRCAREPFRVGEFVCLMRTATVCMLVEIDSIDGEQVIVVYKKRDADAGVDKTRKLKTKVSHLFRRTSCGGVPRARAGARPVHAAAP